MEKYHSFCLTIRPRQGLTMETQGELLKWIKKQDYYFAVIEMQDVARHMHAQIWLETPREKGKINTSIQRICERTIDDWDPAQLKCLRMGTRIAYSDWYNSYLEENEGKLEAANILAKLIPNKTMDFYASEEEQDEIEAKFLAKDKYFYELEKGWKDSPWNGSYVSWTGVKEYFAWRWFVERTLPVQRSSVKRLDDYKCLYMYLRKVSIEPDWKQIIKWDESEKKKISKEI